MTLSWKTTLSVQNYLINPTWKRIPSHLHTDEWEKRKRTCSQPHDDDDPYTQRPLIMTSTPDNSVMVMSKLKMWERLFQIQMYHWSKPHSLVPSVHPSQRQVPNLDLGTCARLIGSVWNLTTLVRLDFPVIKLSAVSTRPPTTPYTHKQRETDRQTDRQTERDRETERE